MKKVARLLAVGGVSAMTAVTLAALPGTALANTDCTSESGGTMLVNQPGVAQVKVIANPGGLSGGATEAVGVCGWEGLTPGFTGGTVEAGVGSATGVLYGPVPVVDPNPGTGGHTACGWGASDPQCTMTAIVSGIPGVYLVAQGQEGNTAGGGQLQGYAGLSTYENNAGGSGTNSGGEIGIEGIAVYNIPSPIVCGDTSGHDWSNTTRQGCEFP
jgi:hypothetical protein